jgi:protein with PEP-CTERM/exosortase system signal
MKSTFASILLLVSALTSQATTYTFNPNPVNLNDLDHHMAYTWQLSGLSLGGNITSASLTFTNIYNWDNTANTLFIHLLDTALATPTHTLINGAYPTILGTGVGSEVTAFTDAPTIQAPVTDINDDFAGARYLANPLVNGSTTLNTFLTSYSGLTTTPIPALTYTFTAAQLGVLQSYIMNGSNIAFGIDPDCHYFNDKVTFTYSCPDAGGTAALLGFALLPIAAARRKFCA